MLDVATESPVNAPDLTVKPVKTAVNWQEVREEYLSSPLPAKDIAKKYGVSVANLYQVSKRQGWQRVAGPVNAAARKAAKAVVERQVKAAAAMAQPAIEAAVKEWQERVLNTAGKAVAQTDEHLSGSLDVDSLKTAVTALDVADRVGRRALGLDKDVAGTDGATTFRLALGLRLELLDSRSVADIAAPVVDVDPA